MNPRSIPIGANRDSAIRVLSDELGRTVHRSGRLGSVRRKVKGAGDCNPGYKEGALKQLST